MARKQKRKDLTILNLPFKSILDERPKADQFVMIAWDIGGFSGYESIFWNNDNDRCKHCVLWLPLSTNHLYTRQCAVTLSKLSKAKLPVLHWSEHFSYLHEGKYVSKSKLPKPAVKEYPSCEVNFTKENAHDTATSTATECGC